MLVLGAWCLVLAVWSLVLFPIPGSMMLEASSCGFRPRISPRSCYSPAANVQLYAHLALVKRLIGIILFLGISAGLIWLVWLRPVKPPEEEKKPEAEVPVHVGKITKATLHAYVTAYGTVE